MPGTYRPTAEHPCRMLKRASSKAVGERRPEAYLSHPPTAELPRQLVTRVGYVEDLVEPRTKLGARFNILLVGHLLAAQVYFSHALIALHRLDVPFTYDSAIVQYRHNTGDLSDKLHVVLDNDDRMFLRQRLKQSTCLFCLFVGHSGDRFVHKEQRGIL